jgi:NAD+ synthase (glutamine-hydrolysing)
MQVGFAQINTTVGALKQNFDKVFDAYSKSVAAGAELVLTPELALTGYPPQDLVFKSRFVPETWEAITNLHQRVGRVPLLVGYVDFNPSQTGKQFVNACAVLQQGQPIRKVFKTRLPTYDVFDEARYFEPQTHQEPIELAGRRVGITICEDIWTEEFLKRDLYHQDPVANLVAQGAEVIVNLSSSPFHVGKPGLRINMVKELATSFRVPFYYCNAIGGNDELIFDGNSFVIDKNGQTVASQAPFEEEVSVLDADHPGNPFVEQSPEEEIYRALVLGVRDYFLKCGFKTAVLGLSGGIDSAVTAVIAADALGRENVTTVSMPSQYSSQGSLDDAESLARNLSIPRYVLPIKEPFEVLKSQFKEVFAGKREDGSVQ